MQTNISNDFKYETSNCLSLLNNFDLAQEGVLAKLDIAESSLTAAYRKLVVVSADDSSRYENLIGEISKVRSLAQANQAEGQLLAELNTTQHLIDQIQAGKWDKLPNILETFQNFDHLFFSAGTACSSEKQTSLKEAASQKLEAIATLLDTKEEEMNRKLENFSHLITHHEKISSLKEWRNHNLEMRALRRELKAYAEAFTKIMELPISNEHFYSASLKKEVLVKRVSFIDSIEAKTEELTKFQQELKNCKTSVKLHQQYRQAKKTLKLIAKNPDGKEAVKIDTVIRKLQRLRKTTEKTISGYHLDQHYYESIALKRKSAQLLLKAEKVKNLVNMEKFKLEFEQKSEQLDLWISRYSDLIENCPIAAEGLSEILTQAAEVAAVLDTYKGIFKKAWKSEVKQRPFVLRLLAPDMPQSYLDACKNFELKQHYIVELAELALIKTQVSLDNLAPCIKTIDNLIADGNTPYRKWLENVSAYVQGVSSAYSTCIGDFQAALKDLKHTFTSPQLYEVEKGLQELAAGNKFKQIDAQRHNLETLSQHINDFEAGMADNLTLIYSTPIRAFSARVQEFIKVLDAGADEKFVELQTGTNAKAFYNLESFSDDEKIQSNFELYCKANFEYLKLQELAATYDWGYDQPDYIAIGMFMSKWERSLVEHAKKGTLDPPAPLLQNLVSVWNFFALPIAYSYTQAAKQIPFIETLTEGRQGAAAREWTHLQQEPQELSPFLKTIGNLFYIGIQITHSILSTNLFTPQPNEESAGAEEPKSFKVTWQKQIPVNALQTAQAFSQTVPVATAQACAVLNESSPDKLVFPIQWAENLAACKQYKADLAAFYEETRSHLEKDEDLWSLNLKYKELQQDLEKLEQEAAFSLKQNCPFDLLGKLQEWQLSALAVTENVKALRQMVEQRNLEEQSLDELKAFIDSPTIEPVKTPLLPPSIQFYNSITESVKNLKKFFNFPVDDAPSPIRGNLQEKIILHALGDKFGKESTWEGGDPYLLLNHRAILLQKKLAVTRNEQEQQLLQQLLDQVQKAMAMREAFTGDFSNFELAFTDKVSELQPGESFFFHGGWTNFQGGHAIIYEIEKQENNGCTFRIYNTGNGLQYHTGAGSAEGTYVVNTVEKNDILLDRLTSPVILKALWDVGTHAVDKHVKKWGKEEPYFIFTMLGGNTVTREIPLSKTKLRQHSGTCSWKSVESWFYQTLNNQDFLRIDFEIRFKTLLDYFKHNEDYLKTDETTFNLFHKSLRKFSQDFVLVYAKSEMLTKKEVIYVQKELSAVKGKVEAIRQTYEKKRNENAISFRPDKIQLANLEHPVNFYEVYFNEIPQNALSSKYSSDELHFEYNAKTIASDLESIANQAEAMLQQDKLETVAAQLELVISKIPIETTCLKEESKQLITQLNRLSTTFSAALMKVATMQVHTDKGIETSYLLTHLKILTIAHRQYSKHEGVLLAPPSPILSKLIQDRKLIGYHSFSVQKDEDLEYMTAYWKEQLKNTPHEMRSYYATDRQCLDRYRGLYFFHFSDQIHDQSEMKYFLANQQVAESGLGEQQNRLEKQIFLYADEVDGKVNPHRKLPSAFYQMRDMFLLSAALNQFHFSEQLINVEKPVVCTAKRVVLGPPRTDWHMAYRVFGMDLSHSRYKGMEEGTGKQELISDSNLAALAYKNAKEKTGYFADFKQVETGAFTHTTMQSDEVNANIAKTPQRLGTSFDLQTTRSLLALQSEKELQLEKTIAYFAENPAMLTHKDTLVFIQTLVFEPGVLTAAWSGPPEEVAASLNQCQEFFEKVLNYHEKVGREEQIAPLFQLMRRLTGYAEELRLQHPNMPLEPLSWAIFHKMADKYLSRQISPEAKSCIARELAISQLSTSHLTVKELKEFLKYNLLFKQRPLYEALHSTTSEQELAQKIELHKIALLKLLSENPEVLSEVHTEVYGGSKQQWQLQQGIATSADNLWKMDPLEGWTLFYGEQQVELDRRAAASREYNAIFGTRAPKKVSKVGEHYLLEDHAGAKYTLHRSGNSYNIYRIEGGKHYFLQPDSHILPIHVIPEVHTWYEYKSRELLLTKKTDGSVFARAIVYNNKIINLTREIEGKTLIMAEADIPELALFANIEEQKYIRVWKKAGTRGQIELVELPRLGLSFNAKLIKGELRLYCNQADGFYLEEKQYLPAFKNYQPYALLRNERGKQQALIPYTIPTKGANSSSLSTAASLAKEVQDTHGVGFCNVSADGKLLPTDNTSRFFLALVHLWQQDYELAQAYLAGTGPAKDWKAILGPLDSEGSSPQERKILNWLGELLEPAKDNDPRAIAIMLRANLRLIQDAVDFPQSSLVEVSEKFLQNTAALYDTYIHFAKELSGFQLSREEELLLQAKVPGTDVTRARLKFLLLGIEEPLSSLNMDAHNLPDKSNQLTLSYNDFSSTFFWSKKMLPVGFMRKKVYEYFIPLYTAAKDLTGVAAKDLLKQYLEIEPKDGLEYRKELELALHLQLRVIDSKIEQNLLLLLFAVFHSPEKFPDISTLEEKIFPHPRLPGESDDAYKKRAEEGGVYPQGAENNFNNLLFTPASQVLQSGNVANKLMGGKSKSSAKEEAAQIIPNKSALPGQEPLEAKPLQLSLPEPPPALRDLAKSIAVTAATAGTSKKLLTAQHELQELFSVDTGDPVANRLFSHTKASVENYVVKEQSTPKTHYEFKDSSCGLSPAQTKFSLKEQLEQSLNTGALQQNLELSIASATLALQAAEAEIVTLANKDPADTSLCAIKHLALLSGEKAVLDLDDLLILFLRQDMSGFNKKNEALSAQEITTLYNKIGQYLVNASHLQALQRSNQLTKELLVARAPEERQRLLENLVRSLEAKREYDPSAHPEYLVFEYYMQILMYKDQIESLDKLQISNGKIHNYKEIGNVLEMRTGGGKTEILLPLLAFLNADGENFSIVMMTEALYSNMGGRLAAKLGKTLSQELEVIEFSRDTDVLQGGLERLLLRFEAMRQNHEVLLVKSEQIQSLYLKFIELLEIVDGQNDQFSPEQEKAIKTFREIFLFFHKYGVLSIDEIDAILQARKLFQFTLDNTTAGTPHSVHQTHRAFTSSLYKILLTDKRFAMNLDCSAQAGAQAFTPENFNKMKSSLVDELLKQNLGVDDPHVIAFLTNLSTANLELVKAYLLQAPDQERQIRTSFFGYGPSNPVVFVSQQPLVVQNVLALLKKEIHELLPLTLTQKIGEDYGMEELPAGVENTRIIPIPFEGIGNPLINARDGSPYEELNHAIQYYVKKGIPLRFIESEIEAWQQSAAEQLANNQDLKPSQTKAQEQIDLLFGQGVFQVMALHKQKEELKAAIDNSVERKLFFIDKYVAPHVTVFPLRLSIGPQIYGWLMKRVLGFTATTQTADTFPNNLSLLPQNEAAGRTLTILWQNRKHAVSSISTPPSQHLTQPEKRAGVLIDHLAEQVSDFKSYSVIIDMGAQFREVPDNELVMKAWLSRPEIQQRTPVIQAGHTFDPESKPRLIPHNYSGALSTVPKENKLFYYSQREITGVDEKLADKAKALVFIGEHTTIRDLLQAVGRLRGLGNQLPHFIVTAEVEQLIVQTLNSFLNEPAAAPLQLEHILLFVTYNQAMRQGDDNERSFKEKMVSILHEAFNEAVIDSSFDLPSLLKLYKEIRELFVQKVADEPFALFGQQETKQPAPQVAAELLNTHKSSAAYQSLQKLQQVPSLSDKVPIQHLDRQFEDLIARELPRLPAKLSMAAQLGSRLQVQTKTNTQTQTTTTVEGLDFKNVKNPWPHVEIFQEEWDRSSFYRPAEPYKIRRLSQPPALKFQEGKIVSLNQVLADQELPVPFDSAILATINLMPIYAHLQTNTPPYTPLNGFQKEIEALLLVTQKYTRETYPVYVDQKEAAQLKKYLKQNSLENRGLQFALFPIDNPNLVVQGKNRVAPEELFKTTPKLKHWLVQAKFFNGETDYSNEELKSLEDWILSTVFLPSIFPSKLVSKVQELETLFTETLIKYKAPNRKKYPLSTLKQLFDRLKKTPS